MGNNVDISEVVDFSNDLQEASSDIKASLDSVREQIEKINAMDSFSGKAAKEAKNYFGDFHLTILESFQGLFDELEENLQQHINTFESDVDSSDSAIVKSNYLQEVKEEINEVFEDLKKQDEIIHDTIQEVSDISPATPPSFSDVNEWKNKTDKKIKELDEDLEAFTGAGDETDVKAIMNQIENAMSHAKTSEGKARFSNVEGASQQSELTKLKAFNEDKKKAVEEKIENLDDQSKAYIKQAQADYKNQNIDKATYESIRSEIIQNGLFFIQNAKESNLSRNVSEQVQKDVSEWANKAYDINHMVSSSQEHQAIDPYHAIMHPDLLFPMTYRHHHAPIKKAKTEDKKKEETTQHLAGQGNITTEEEIDMQNYLNRLNKSDGKNKEETTQNLTGQGTITADEEMDIRNYLGQLDENDGKNKVNKTSSPENQISEANKEAVEILKEKDTKNKAPEDVNRAREPLTVWDQKEVVSRDSDLAGDTDTLGHFATAGLNFAFEDIRTIIDPDTTVSDKMLSGFFLFGKPAKLVDRGHDLYKTTHNAKKANENIKDIKKGDKSNIAPGGGLAAHKKRGGHLIERHIGKSDREMLERVKKNPKISGASTFKNRATAERVTNNVLTNEKNKKTIQSWLNSPKGKSKLPLSYHGEDVIGRGIKKGSYTIENMTNAKVILKKDGDGSFILTGYPN